MKQRSALGNGLYRGRQFFAALLGRVDTAGMAEARRVLGPDLYSIYEAMPGQYRLHMLAVYRRVRESGCADRDAWQAALLHDSGKYDPESGRYVTIPYRVALVLLEAAGPGRVLLGRLSSPPDQGLSAGRVLARRMGWRYPFYLLAQHAELGARLASQHGAGQTVVRLVANHHRRHHNDALLAALQAADDRS